MRTDRLNSIVAIAILICALPAAPARAQATDVPLELVHALLLQPEVGTYPEVLVGEAPAIAGVDAGDGRVVGAVVRRTGPTVAIARRGERRNLLDRALAQLQAAGWQAAPARIAARGFLPPAGETSTWLCRDGVALTVSVRAASGDESFVVYRLNEREAGSICREPEPEPDFLQDLPVLRSPAGATVRATGYRGGGVEAARAEVVSSASDDELLTHYEQQMVEQGWTRLDGYAGTALHLSVLQRQSAVGLPRAAVLSIVSAPGARIAEVRIMGGPETGM